MAKNGINSKIFVLVSTLHDGWCRWANVSSVGFPLGSMELFSIIDVPSKLYSNKRLFLRICT